MRTTVTLDDDVAAKLQAEACRSGLSFKQAVNDALRRRLNAKPNASQVERFRVDARDLGRMSPSMRLDNVGDFLETVEGPHAR